MSHLLIMTFYKLNYILYGLTKVLKEDKDVGSFSIFVAMNGKLQ